MEVEKLFSYICFAHISYEKINLLVNDFCRHRAKCNFVRYLISVRNVGLNSWVQWVWVSALIVKYINSFAGFGTRTTLGELFNANLQRNGAARRAAYTLHWLPSLDLLCARECSHSFTLSSIPHVARVYLQFYTFKQNADENLEEQYAKLAKRWGAMTHCTLPERNFPFQIILSTTNIDEHVCLQTVKSKAWLKFPERYIILI